MSEKTLFKRAGGWMLYRLFLWIGIFITGLSSSSKAISTELFVLSTPQTVFIAGLFIGLPFALTFLLISSIIIEHRKNDGGL